MSYDRIGMRKGIRTGNMQNIRLEFKDGTNVVCKILGSTEVNGIRYAVFFDEETKDVYIYRYKQKRGRKCKLIAITDNDEFKSVCARLNSMVTPSVARM